MQLSVPLTTMDQAGCWLIVGITALVYAVELSNASILTASRAP